MAHVSSDSRFVIRCSRFVITSGVAFSVRTVPTRRRAPAPTAVTRRAGRWSKIKLYFSLFPLYKHATFKRQKAYMRSERLR